MNAKILVADVSESSRMSISSMLSGFEVLTAADGADAMNKISENMDIDLILLDLHMPVMDGFQILHNLRNDPRYSNIRTIILTDSGDADDEAEGLRSGAADFIRRPIHPESLRARIDIHLKLRNLQNNEEHEKELIDAMVRERTEELIKQYNTTSEMEALFRTVFDQAPIGISITPNEDHVLQDVKDTIFINRMFENITGRAKEDLGRIRWESITHPDDIAADQENFAKFKTGKSDGYDLEKRYIRPDGTEVWVHMIIAPITYKDTKQRYHICLAEDISSRKAMEKALHESERSKRMLLSNLPGMAYRCEYNRDWNMKFVSEGCFALTGYKAESLLNSKDLSFNELIAPEYREILWHEWSRLLPNRMPFRYEYEIIPADGKRKWVLEVAQGVYNEEGDVEALEGIIIDITGQKEKESQIQFISSHDYLTGLYDRRYYENIITEYDSASFLPLTVLLVDINGVKLINDAFGYSEGDILIKATSEILQSCSRPGDILARTGGDEFAMIMPKTDNQAADSVRNAIMESCAEFNRTHANSLYGVSFSCGSATRESMEQSIFETQKAADDYLKNRKLLNRKSIRSGLISSILATVYEKSQETEEHARRIADLSKLIGEQLSLSQSSLGELELFSMLHDIGKVGIDDRILKKPGKLTEDEWVVMKSHSAIGYRIANSAAELESVAEFILTHHERWDGKGYPQGLKGDAIPLLSRIVAVADSYDAMTNDRIYRKAMAPEAAVEEIKKNEGIQFDPQIVAIFEKVIDQYLSRNYMQEKSYADGDAFFETE